MFLAGLVLGRTIGWGGQARDDHSVPWSDAARQLWPHTLLGWSCIAMLAFTVPAAIPYALFIAGGLALSIPLAVVTSWPAVGRAADARRHRRAAGGERAARAAAQARAARDRGGGAARLTMREALRTLRGVLRSLRIYYGGRHNRDAMDRLYARFVKPGDLVFDVGSHVGDRIAAFRRLGARVVASSRSRRW